MQQEGISMKSNRRSFLRVASVASIAAAAAAALPAMAAGADSPQPMDAITALKTRHSIRSYTPQPVSEEDLQLILQAAMQAPSAANQQPWDLVVIRNKDTLAKVGDINHYAAYASKAPLAILVCLNLGKEKDVTKGMGIIDVSLCAENILLAAHALGLGAVFTGIYPEKDRIAGFQKLLELPDDVIPIGLIVIGHPMMSIKKAEDRFNKSAVHMEKWQGSQS